MLVALLLAHGAALSAPRAALSTHRAQRTALSAKKRDYMSGGLGSSKQEKFAQLWRNRNDPEVETEAPPTDLAAWEKEIKRAEAADALVPDANWRLRGAAGKAAGAATSDTARSLASAYKDGMYS